MSESHKNEILVLDIETTEFLNNGGLIVEVGIVSLNLVTGEIKKIYTSLCKEKDFGEKHRQKPYGWIFKNSDLDFDDIMESRDFDVVKGEVQSILDDYPLGATAFNNKFDFDFLESRELIIKTKLPCPMLLSTNICKLPGKFRGKYKWPKVEEAYEFFFPESEYIEAHRGQDDAKHEAEIVYELYKRGVFKLKGICTERNPSSRAFKPSELKTLRKVVDNWASDTDRDIEEASLMACNSKIH